MASGGHLLFLKDHIPFGYFCRSHSVCVCPFLKTILTIGIREYVLSFL